MGDKKFKAFISYSHADEAWAGWLQRSFERFRAPGSLAASLQAEGKSTRLSPVFRDREDLPVAGSLNSAIQAALADSEFQIVICSPNAARSRWVNEEIKFFRRQHGPERVFAVIVGGEPGASAIAGREGEECLPPALRFELDANGDLTDAPAEPLAADAREKGDGKRHALLKVAAGMLGVGLDDLVRRDVARRTRQAWTIAGASVAGAVATTALAFYAIAKGNEATLMRGKAENLVEFMLTDLKERLEPVGRLDVLEAVGEHAMDYYAGQNLNSLDDDALARRANAMILLGTIYDQRTELDKALSAFEAAEAATRRLYDRAPNNPDRVFDHAQSAFYVGDAALKRRDQKTAEERYLEYLRLAERLVGFDADNPKWRLELAYATSNLGILKFEVGDYEAAIALFSKSIEARRVLVEQSPDDRKLRNAYAYSISWRAVAEMNRGNFREAIGLIRKQLDVYGDDAGPQSESFDVLDAAVTAQHRLAESHLWLGEIDEATAAIADAKRIADRLMAREDRNSIWIYNASYVDRLRSTLLRLAGDEAAAMAAADSGVRYAKSLVKESEVTQSYRAARGAALAERLLFGDSYADAADNALEIEKMLDEAIQSDVVDNASFIGAGTLALADYWMRNGEIDRAARKIAAAIARLAGSDGKYPITARLNLAKLHLKTGEREAAAEILKEFHSLGFRHPDMAALQNDLPRIAGN